MGLWVDPAKTHPARAEKERVAGPLDVLNHQLLQNQHSLQAEAKGRMVVWVPRAGSDN